MAEMTEEEWRAFLRKPVRPAMLDTVRPHGRPHVAPMGEEHAEAFGRRQAAAGEQLVRVTPTKVVGRKHISD